MSWICIILPIMVSAVVTALMVPFIIRLSYKKKLFDTINERTVHKGTVPRLGGSAFILSVTVAVVLAVILCQNECPECWRIPGCGFVHYAALVLAAVIIYLAGVLDDIRTINYKYKFLCQFVSALLIVEVAGFWINDFYGLLGLTALSAFTGKAFTVLLIMYIINAFNLIDGIDGLASSLGVIAAVVMGVLFMLFNQLLMAVLSFALAISLMVFFCFNKFGTVECKTKIFMGDGGSQTMGLIIAFLVVFISMRKDGLYIPYRELQSPEISFCLIVIPCLDAVRVMVGRIIRHANPFLPDKTHIHHKFLRIGFSATRTLISILLLDIFMISLNIVLTVIDLHIDNHIKINIILAVDLIVWWAVHKWLNCGIRKNECNN